MATTIALKILKSLREHGPLTFAEIVQATSLAFAVVDAAVDQLRRDGLVFVSDRYVRLSLRVQQSLEEHAP